MIPEDLPWSLHRTATSKIIINIEIMFDETSMELLSTHCLQENFYYSLSYILLMSELF